MPVELVKRESLENYVGTERAPTPWITLDQTRISSFADTTEDHQFIHVDEEAAKKTPFGGTIAHGMLTLSMIAKMGEDFAIVPEGAVMGLNYGFDKVRFLAPVKSGSRVRGRATIAEIKDKGHQVLIKYQVTMEIEDEDKPAAVCEWLGAFPMG